MCGPSPGRARFNGAADGSDGWMDGSWQLLNNSSAIHSIWLWLPRLRSLPSPVVDVVIDQEFERFESSVKSESANEWNGTNERLEVSRSTWIITSRVGLGDWGSEEM